jgi:general secretion pathway protein L
MSTLIIPLPLSAGDTATRYDYVLTPEGQTVGVQSSAAATGLPDASQGVNETVAVVPVEALSWHQLELPKGIGPNAPRLRAVLQSLLEDRLLDDLEDLHLAIGPETAAGGTAWVAVCGKTWLRQHLQALEAAGRPVTRIVPEFAPHAGALQVHGLGEPGQARCVISGQGVEGGVVHLPLTAAMPAFGLGRDTLPEDAEILAEPAVAALAEQLLQHKTVLQQRPQRWVLAAQTSWDLAQFDLASTGRTRMLKRISVATGDFLHAPRWRAARWGAVLCIAAQLVGLNAWAWKEQAALKSRRSAIHNALTQTFPAVQVVVDAPVQMAREVAALRQTTGAPSGRDLEAMLAALGSVVPAGKAASAIEFTSGEARLKGLQLDPGESDSVTTRLKTLGYALRPDGESLVLKQDTAP